MLMHANNIHNIYGFQSQSSEVKKCELETEIMMHWYNKHPIMCRSGLTRAQEEFLKSGQLICTLINGRDPGS